MPREKVEFTNANGQTLAGLLERPGADTPLKAVALFAHCFTCGKDVAAASRIGRMLASRGFAVLRFDFTGLGGSDGDFGNTNFSSNIEDLRAAADYLAETLEAPRLLIGHSLGGAAALVAARQLDSVEAVATIGAPSNASHVKHLFASEEDRIRDQGEAEVTLGGRSFRVREQMLDDLVKWNSPSHIAGLRKPLVIFHSPVDAVVSIDEAAAIYQAAKHPKSFVSLDKADHMLSTTADAEYVADVLVAWASRYL